MPTTRPARLPAFVAAFLLAAGAAHANTAKPQRRAAAPSVTAAESSSGNFLAAMGASAQRDTAAAAGFIREALRVDPRTPELVDLAFNAYLAQGDIGEAARLGRRLLQREPNNSVARLTLAVEAIAQRQYASARERLSPGVARGRAELTATLLTAWAFAGSQQWAKAQETLDRLRNVNNPGISVFVDYHAGLLADLAGRPDEAERRIKAAWEASNRASLRLAEAYARVLARRGDVAGAKQTLATFEERAGRNPLIRALAADIEAGRQVARMATNPQQGASEAMYGLGSIGLGASEGGRGENEMAAIVYLRLALFLDPRHDLAAATLAEVYERLKRYDHAVALYEGIDPKSPLAPAADVQIGLNLENSGDSAAAVTRLAKAVEARPDDIDAWMALGNVHRAQKRYREAVDAFTRAIDLVPTPQRQHWTLFYFRGSAYERLKEWPKGEADLKKALELYPDQPQVLNYLGYTWVDLHTNLDEGVKMVRRAVELTQGRDGYIVDSLGWAYYRLGQYEDAVRELERAVLLRPADATINDHLGDAYWKVGRKLEAGFQWSHARDLKPEPEDLAKIEKKLADGLEEPTPATAVTPPTAEADKEKGG